MQQSPILNRKNKNGSINLLAVTGEEIGAIVSPYHPDFRSQIEDGIWPIVSLLIDKGYFVVDSCEGHLDFGNNDPSHFTVAFTNDNDAFAFKTALTLPGVICKAHNTWLYVADETAAINGMFLNNASRYQFVSVNIVPGNYPGSKLVKVLLTSLVRQYVLRILRKIKNYERIY
jgi:hypothetical protein